MTVTGIVLRGRACYLHTRDAFQPSRLTGVRLWPIITLQTVW